MTDERPPVPGAVKISSIDMAGRHHSARTKARKQALDVLYEADLLERDPFQSLATRLDDPDATVRDFTRELVLGVRDHAEQIDRRINQSAPADWPVERMACIDRNLARIAIYELDHTSIDARAAISEAIELADELSTDTSVTFLNGLLARAAANRPAGIGQQESAGTAE